ncbi:cell wall hydrolase [Pseudomonas sp. UBA4194]|jgi:spore germination cell wall hydrolase CwlJ-like protein|uniref:cell wall hydrolase n=1 Tax=Pseudomonas sp. UBA4194 TaxID=1947317 RepID=UPI0025CEF4EA|nr:cell wall hydrolase [Pseudomonas sp. UBA4194]
MRALALTLCFAVFPLNLLAAPIEPAAAQAESKAQVLEEKAANNETASPVAKAQTITKTEVQAVDPAGKESVDDALTCLSRTIYWEAKGGAAADMEAVAEVVLNRVGHNGFPDTICGVVKQGSEHKSCQFSWWCDGRADQVQEEDRYVVSKEIARRALNQQLKDRTQGALYFHDRDVSPSWVKTLIKTGETAEFKFYRPRGD